MKDKKIQSKKTVYLIKHIYTNLMFSILTTFYEIKLFKRTRINVSLNVFYIVIHLVLRENSD